MVLYCSKEKEVDVHYRLKEKELMLYCSCFQEKGTGVLLFYGDGR